MHIHCLSINSIYLFHTWNCSFFSNISWRPRIETGTPLWRNGPPDKPVLCNACGSRWRTKGTLANYTPLHARADPDEYDDKRISRLKNLSMFKIKEVKPLKRKQHPDSGVVVGVIPDHDQSFHKAVEEDTSNRSSSGSAISNSESCAQFGSADASDLTGWSIIQLTCDQYHQNLKILALIESQTNQCFWWKLWIGIWDDKRFNYRLYKTRLWVGGN